MQLINISLNMIKIFGFKFCHLYYSMITKGNIYMQSLLEGLNEKQKQAVTSDSDTILVLAGAGSGKTRVITYKIAYLIKEKQVYPDNIMAVTFTNKAANEMSERVQSYLGERSSVLIRTFHSFGTWFLHRYAYLLDFSENFNIIDSDDQAQEIKKTIKQIRLDNPVFRSESDRFRDSEIINKIRRFKMKLLTPEMIEDPYIYQVYDSYETIKKRSNCFDFEDLLQKPIEILQKNPRIAEKLRLRFQYIMVDEYQDTNYAQHLLLKQLKGEYNQVLVVGDEDQSIYSFRGAEVENIINFSRDNEKCEVILLEKNYRSTKKILDAANAVAANNEIRIGKNLWTDAEEGDPLTLMANQDESDEAQAVLNTIHEQGLNYTDTVILYRINNQSRAFEEILNRTDIPYRIIGNIRFYEREEIKDTLCYLKLLVNPFDQFSFKRIINKPARGIGPKSLNTILETSKRKNGDLLETLALIKKDKILTGKALSGIVKFRQNYDLVLEKLEDTDLDELIYFLCSKFALFSFYKEKSLGIATDKEANLKELIKSSQRWGKGKKALSQFLERLVLDSDKENPYEKNDLLTLMTIHNAKGLEFDNVFVTGLEEDLFPYQYYRKSEHDMEEERRLFYVAITRARKKLFLSYSKSRNLYGKNMYNFPSRFLKEIPANLFEQYPYDNESNGFSVGNIVRHANYGVGKIIAKKQIGRHDVVFIDFFHGGQKEFIEKYAKLELVE